MKENPREILDVENIQLVTDAFYAATGIPSSIITTDGEILTGSGWQDACTHFHRQNAEAATACRNSDIKIRQGLLMGEKRVIYKCPHGLIDAAAPIVVEGRHVANYFTGQFFFEKPDAEKLRFFEEQAERYGFDQTAYLKAIRRIPVISEDRIEHILEYLARFAEMIARMGYARRKNRIVSEQLQQSHDELENRVRERTRSLKQANLDLKNEIERRKIAE